MADEHRGLVVVDVQRDFCPGGSLAVAAGDEVARRIGELLGRQQGRPVADRPYDAIVATRDHHVDPGEHFSDNPDFLSSWPPHCVVGTPGAQLHPALPATVFDAVFDKGAQEAAYSGFEGADADGADLAGWLRAHHIDAVDVVGLATDHCVRATALDALRLGLDARVLLDLTAGVAEQTTAAAIEELRAAGAELVGEPAQP